MAGIGKKVRKVTKAVEKVSSAAEKSSSKVNKVKGGSLKKVDASKADGKNLPVVAKPAAGGGGNGVKPPVGHKAYKNAADVGPHGPSPVVKGKSGVPARKPNRNSMLEDAKVVTGNSSNAAKKAESSAVKAIGEGAKKEEPGRFKKALAWGKGKLKNTAAAKAIKAQSLIRKNKKGLKAEEITESQKNALNKGIGKEKKIRNENLKKIGKRSAIGAGAVYLYSRDKKQREEIASLKKQVEDAKRRPATQQQPQQSTPTPSNTPERKPETSNGSGSRSGNGGSSKGGSSSGQPRVKVRPSVSNGTYSGSATGGPGRGRRSVEAIKEKESGKTDRYIAKQEGKTARTKIRADRSVKRQEQKTIRQTNRQNKKTERQAKRQTRRSNRRNR